MSRRHVVLNKPSTSGSLTRLLCAVLTMALVSVATAADLTAKSASPRVTFDDTDGPSPAWELLGSGQPPPGPPNRFFLNDLVSGTTVFSIAASTTNSNTLTVDAAAGNVGLANNTMFIDRLNGLVGVGTVIPLAPLNVARADGTAQILVEETNATVAARNMFQLINNGPIGFNMTNTDAALNWRFAAQTTGFRVSLDGTGGPEMEVGNGGTLQVGPGGASNLFLDATGNMTIAGTLTQSSDRNAKTKITALNAPDVLTKLTTLPISQWAYKRTPTVTHIGPMAQDFKAAFGLGADDKHLAPGDLAGVAVAGVQALHKVMEAQGAEMAKQEAKIAEQDARIAERDAEITELKQRLTALEEMISRVMALRTTHTAQR